MDNTAPLGPAPTSGGAAQVALSAQRLAVLDHTRTHAPVRVADAAAGLGLHPNTVRAHLDALVALGLLERTAAATGGRGRPAARYGPSAADPAVPVRTYSALATVLAGQLARVDTHPEHAARAAGIEWGRGLVDEPGPEGVDPRRTVLDVLARLGFALQDEQAEAPAAKRGIAVHRCPLLDAARRHPGVVCQVHLGIVLGVLEKLGVAAPTGVDLVAFAEPGACRLFLPDPTVTGAA